MSHATDFIASGRIQGLTGELSEGGRQFLADLLERSLMEFPIACSELAL